jgi:hypothetical protein
MLNQPANDKLMRAQEAFLFAGVVLIERTRRDSCHTGDLSDGNGVVAAPGNDLEHGAPDPRPLVLSNLIGRLPGPGLQFPEGRVRPLGFR